MLEEVRELNYSSLKICRYSPKADRKTRNSVFSYAYVDESEPEQEVLDASYDYHVSVH